MNILFLTIIKIDSITDRGVYPDLMRKFSNEGHKVYIVTPLERRYKIRTTLFNENNVSILKINTLNIQKTNSLEKWLAILLIKYQFQKGIREFFSKVNFDLILYSTPPLTFLELVGQLKAGYKAQTYLLLKDIFPQNAVDLGMIKKGGLIHRYFIRKERKLYVISDHIGCMSQANKRYVLLNNPDINPEKVEINPNSHEFFEETVTYEEKLEVRRKYKIPLYSTIFVYGGNLGKPQGIDFLLEFLDSQKNKPEIFFLVIGSGTEYPRIRSWFDLNKPENSVLLSVLPKEDYNLLLRSCDVGMIFLDRRFTVPNFPSRLLSYMEYGMPIVAATDINTDLGKTIVENDFGLWSEAGDLATLDFNINKLSKSPALREKMGKNGFDFFLKNYTVNNSYQLIINHFNKLN
jgi:glycosyltransferase involved in cell wall biosynthesis